MTKSGHSFLCLQGYEPSCHCAVGWLVPACHPLLCGGMACTRLPPHTVRRDRLYPPATPPLPVTPPLCCHDAVERHVTDVSHDPSMTNLHRSNCPIIRYKFSIKVHLVLDARLHASHCQSTMSHCTAVINFAKCSIFLQVFHCGTRLSLHQ